MEVVYSLDELESPRSVYGKDLPNFEMLDAKGHPRGAECPKRGPVSARKTDRLRDLRLLRVTGAHDTVLDHADLFSVTSAQLKTVLELYDMEIHQKISLPNYQKLKTMVKRRIDQKLRLRNFDARHGRIEPGAVVKSRKG